MIRLGANAEQLRAAYARVRSEIDWMMGGKARMMMHFHLGGGV